MQDPVIDQLRPATPADEPAIVACVRAAYARYLDRMEQPPAPITADYHARISRGVVWVLPGPSGMRGVLVMWPVNEHLFLENIAVAPAEQGQGVGRRLIAAVEAYARERDLSAVELYTNEVMTENLSFYARLGFVEIERRLEDGFRRVFLRKTLTPS